MSTVSKEKSCLDCPCFLDASEAGAYFGKNIGVPVCAKYGKVFGQMGPTSADPEKLEGIGQNYARNCPGYGSARPSVDWSKVKMEVALPTTDSVMNAATPENQPDAINKPTTCVSCRWFVPEDAVVNEFRWAAGLCSAKGKLLLGSRYTAEAKNCVQGENGMVKRDLADINVLPVVQGIGVTAAPLIRADVTPEDYESDRPVSSADAEAGIKSWRKIANPKDSEQFTFLPIYSPDWFKEEQRIKIPKTGDDEHPEEYVDHFGGVYALSVFWRELDETPALWGDAGTGKTELFRHMAWLMGLPFERISFNNATELDDLAGKPHFDPAKGTYFVYGRLAKAWMQPCVLGLDEPNTSRKEVQQFVRPMIDNSKVLVLDMNAGELLPRNDDCYPGMAMNPAWDPKNMGTDPMADADANRLMHILVPMPPREVEEAIIKQWVAHDGWQLSTKQLNTVMKVAEDIRKLIEEGTLSSISWAIRPQVKVARALRWFTPLDAYRKAIADYLEPETREAILDQVKTHFK